MPIQTGYDFRKKEIIWFDIAYAFGWKDKPDPRHGQSIKSAKHRPHHKEQNMIIKKLNQWLFVTINRLLFIVGWRLLELSHNFSSWCLYVHKNKKHEALTQITPNETQKVMIIFSAIWGFMAGLVMGKLLFE